MLSCVFANLIILDDLLRQRLCEIGNGIAIEGYSI